MVSDTAEKEPIKALGVDVDQFRNVVRRKPGSYTLRGVQFNPASPQDAQAQIEARLTDSLRVFVECYLSKKSGCYLNATAAARVAWPDAEYPAQQGGQARSNPLVSLLIQWHMAQHGLGRDRALGQLAKWLYDVDMSDFEDYLEGRINLRGLKALGVDTSAIAEIIERRDSEGGVTRAIKLIPKIQLMSQLLRAIGAHERSPDVPQGGSGQHNTQQVVIVSSSVADELRRGVSRETSPGVPAVPIEAGKPTQEHIQAQKRLLAMLEEQAENDPVSDDQGKDDSHQAVETEIVAAKGDSVDDETP